MFPRQLGLRNQNGLRFLSVQDLSTLQYSSNLYEKYFLPFQQTTTGTNIINILFSITLFTLFGITYSRRCSSMGGQLGWWVVRSDIESGIKKNYIFFCFLTALGNLESLGVCKKSALQFFYGFFFDLIVHRHST